MSRKVWDQVTLDFLTAVSRLCSIGGKPPECHGAEIQSWPTSYSYSDVPLKVCGRVDELCRKDASATRADWWATIIIIDSKREKKQQRQRQIKYNKPRLPKGHSRTRAWHAKLWDSRDTSSNHHADNCSVCLPVRLCPACLLYSSSSFLSSLLSVSSSLLMRYTDGDLRAPQVICFVYNDWTERQVKWSCTLPFPSIRADFLLFPLHLFHFAWFLFPFLPSNDGGDSSLFCQSLFLFSFFLYCLPTRSKASKFTLRDLLAIY